LIVSIPKKKVEKRKSYSTPQYKRQAIEKPVTREPKPKEDISNELLEEKLEEILK